MTRHSERKWELWGWAFTVAMGSLLHFVYEWSGKNMTAAAFAAVNESVWEHMKLLAMPWVVWSVAEAIGLRNADLPVFGARAAGLLTGLAAIPTIYYTYTGVIGRHFLWADIAAFILSAGAGAWVSGRVMKKGRLKGLLWQIAGALILLGVAALFVWWTFRPPVWPLFQDARTGLTGILS